MSHSIYHTLNINSIPSKVYNAITNPKELENWWPLKCTGLPKEGEIYNFNFTDKYNWFAKVESYKSDEFINFKMTQADEDWLATTFGFKLKALNGGTVVQFSHVNWPHCNTNFKHSSYCWALLLKGLKDYVENGTIIPFEQRG